MGVDQFIVLASDQFIVLASDQFIVLAGVFIVLAWAIS